MGKRLYIHITVIITVILALLIGYAFIKPQVELQKEVNEAKEYIPEIENMFPLMYDKLEILRTGQFRKDNSFVNYKFLESASLEKYPLIEKEAINYLLFNNELPINPYAILFGNRSFNGIYMEGAVFDYDNSSDLFICVIYSDSDSEELSYNSGVLFKKQLDERYLLIILKDIMPKPPMP